MAVKGGMSPGLKVTMPNLNAPNLFKGLTQRQIYNQYYKPYAGVAGGEAVRRAAQRAMRDAPRQLTPPTTLPPTTQTGAGAAGTGGTVDIGAGTPGTGATGTAGATGTPGTPGTTEATPPTAPTPPTPPPEEPAPWEDASYWETPTTAEDTSTPLIGTDEFERAKRLIADLDQWKSGVQLPTKEEIQQLYQQAYDQQMQNLGYGMEERQLRAQKQREQYLADRGIALGSEAYRGEQQALAEQRAAEAAGLRAQAAQFAEARASGEAQRAQGAAQTALAQQQLIQQNLNTLLGLGTSERQLTSNEMLERARQATNLKVVRAQLGQDDRQFLKKLGLDERTLASNIEAEANRLGLAKEELAARIASEARTAKLNEKKFRREIVQWNKQFKLFSNREMVELDQMIKNGETTRAANMINAQANAASAGAASSNAQLAWRNTDLGYLQDRVFSIAQAQNAVLEKFPGLRTNEFRPAETGSTVTFG